MTLTDSAAPGAWSSAGPSGHAATGFGRRPITLTGRSVPKPRRIVIGAAPPWVKAAVDRLNDLLALPANWDSYGADPVEVDSALAAVAMLDRLRTHRLPEMSASPDGDIELEWAHGELLLVLVVGGTFGQPVAKVLFDWGSGCTEWSTSADDDDSLDSALRKVTEA